MPIFVEWQWIERTKSFLVIFHFFDDWKKPNLRLKTQEVYPAVFKPSEKEEGLFEIWREEHLEPKPYMTWAPSHVELGMFGEILRYANIIDGLKEDEKRALRLKLEGRKFIKAEGTELEIDRELVDGQPKDAIIMFGTTPARFCISISEVYVNKIKSILNPYLK